LIAILSALRKRKFEPQKVLAFHVSNQGSQDTRLVVGSTILSESSARTVTGFRPRATSKAGHGPGVGQRLGFKITEFGRWRACLACLGMQSTGDGRDIPAGVYRRARG
jgi:hypothetical protein